MARPKKTLALIGAGYWGKNLARNFQDLGVLRLICDASPETLDTYGAAYSGVEKTTDVEEIWANAGVEQVAIATPAAKHQLPPVARY